MPVPRNQLILRAEDDPKKDAKCACLPDEENLFSHEKDQGKGPLSEAEIEILIRREVLNFGKDLADMQGFNLDKSKSDTIKPIAESTDIPEAGPSQESDSGKA